jgi:hypothetical protein
MVVVVMVVVVVVACDLGCNREHTALPVIRPHCCVLQRYFWKCSVGPHVQNTHRHLHERTRCHCEDMTRLCRCRQVNNGWMLEGPSGALGAPGVTGGDVSFWRGSVFSVVSWCRMLQNQGCEGCGVAISQT